MEINVSILTKEISKIDTNGNDLSCTERIRLIKKQEHNLKYNIKILEKKLPTGKINYVDLHSIDKQIKKTYNKVCYYYKKLYNIKYFNMCIGFTEKQGHGCISSSLKFLQIRIIGISHERLMSDVHL